jgi:hypothetical protein
MAHGRKTGGRRAGTPNKATVEKTLVAEQAAAEAKAAGKRLAKDVLEEFMHIFAETAARFRRRGDWDKFERWALHAVATAKDLAPYQSPKLSAVMVGAAIITEIEVIGGLPADQDGGLHPAEGPAPDAPRLACAGPDMGAASPADIPPSSGTGIPATGVHDPSQLN